MQSSLDIYTAKWIIPITGEVIENGAVVSFNNKILDLGKKKDMLSIYHGKITKLDDAIICPGLINAHCHLELSYLKGRITSSNKFSEWLKEVISKKEIPDSSLIAFNAKEMKKKGICAVIDIGNDPFWLTLSSLSELNPQKPNINYFIHLNEIIDPKGRLANAIPFIPELNTDLNEYEKDFTLGITPHAPYTVHPETIIAIKKISTGNTINSVHLGESIEENELFLNGSGDFVGLLELRGHWPLSYIPSNCSSTKHLDNICFLDKSTLCVHCIHLNEEDIQILRKNNVSIAICPRSNMLLAGKIADINMILKNQINLCLGTDSLASNDKLSIFAEMSSLASNFPEIDPAKILYMATMGGAKAMKLNDKIGSIEKGKDNCIFAFYPGLKIDKVSEAVEYLVMNADNQLDLTKNSCLMWLNEY